jgi:uncharacterized protein YqgV (UPF0045/DUF77 family)
MAMTLIADFTVEPFVPGAPGPHVTAAIDAARGTGANLVVGPFGNEVSANDDATVLRAVAKALEAGMAAGATRVAIEVRRT